MKTPIIGDLNLAKIGDRLRTVDRFLFNVLSTRLSGGGLSDFVAENKRRASKNGIYEKRRLEVEDARIELVRKWSNDLGLNPNFASTLMYSIISESCLVQDDYMINKINEGIQLINELDEKSRESYLKENLLTLTAAAAVDYDSQYAQQFLATKLHAEFSKRIIFGLMSELKKRSLAIDLGCATGIISYEIAPFFDKVIGYDISPDMVRVAQSKNTANTDHVEFIEKDLEDGFNLSSNSVSLAVMNMGTASDIKNIENVLKSLNHCLHPEGKFLLSFYNSESLLQLFGFLPWPMQIAAHIDQDKQCLEVYCDNDLYFIQASPRSVQDVSKLLDKHFSIDNIYTYPTLASIIPQTIIESEDKYGVITQKEELTDLINQIDINLSLSGINSGVYIIVTGSKKGKA